MKLSAAALFASVLALTAQDSTALKHQAVATSASLQPIRITASNISRDLPDGVTHLKGNVEIRTPICIVTGPGNAHTCAGYMVLRADQADFHGDTGDIEAIGNVLVTREP